MSNEPQLTEYQPLVQKAFSVMVPMLANGSSPQQIAEIVYAATTDGTDQLRYEAGADAKQILGGRRMADDAAFFGGIRSQFGL